MVSKNIPHPGPTDQIFLIQPGGVKIPVTLEIFKHGGGICLAISAENKHATLVGSVGIMLTETRRLIEQAAAVNDQGHISRRGL